MEDGDGDDGDDGWGVGMIGGVIGGGWGVIGDG